MEIFSVLNSISKYPRPNSCDEIYDLTEKFLTLIKFTDTFSTRKACNIIYSLAGLGDRATAWVGYLAGYKVTSTEIEKLALKVNKRKVYLEKYINKPFCTEQDYDHNRLLHEIDFVINNTKLIRFLKSLTTNCNKLYT